MQSNIYNELRDHINAQVVRGYNHQHTFVRIIHREEFNYPISSMNTSN